MLLLHRLHSISGLQVCGLLNNTNSVAGGSRISIRASGV